MKLSKLNADVLFEKDLADLAKDYDKAKDELYDDVNAKIVLKEITAFMKKWQFFMKKYNIKAKRITEIEMKGKMIINYLQRKINNLEKVTKIDKTKIESLQLFLDNFKSDIEAHLAAQKALYAKEGRKK